MHIVYERRGISRWDKGFWYEVESGEKVSSDIVCAELDERWHRENQHRYWKSNIVVMAAPEPRTYPLRKRKTAAGYFRLADYAGLISRALVAMIAVLVVLHFVRTLP